MTSRKSSGSIRADSAVDPTKSENITVTWRRSAVSVFSDEVTLAAGYGRDLLVYFQFGYGTEKKSPDLTDQDLKDLGVATRAAGASPDRSG